MLTYAGIEIGGIPDPDGRLEEMLRQWWHQDGIREHDHPGYHVAGIDHLPIPAAPKRECPKLWTLCWPSGASRWGSFHALVNLTQLNAIYDAVDPVSPTIQTLEILPASGVQALSTRIVASMYMLVPRVIGRHNGGELYLLSLVDKRYHWWNKVANAWDSPASWSELLTDLFTAVGESPSLPSIPAAYDVPRAARWNVGYKPLPLLIDAACATVGLRTVVLPGANSVVVRLPATAITTEGTNWDRYKDEVLTGGRVELADVAVGLPEIVRTVFPGDTPATEDRGIADVTTNFGDFEGIADVVAYVGADLASDADPGDLDNYADQATEDYYSWSESRVDATIRGLADWTPTGLEDRIEWVHERDRVLTRVFRRSASDRNVYGNDPDSFVDADTYGVEVEQDPTNDNVAEQATYGPRTTLHAYGKVLITDVPAADKVQLDFGFKGARASGGSNTLQTGDSLMVTSELDVGGYHDAANDVLKVPSVALSGYYLVTAWVGISSRTQELALLGSSGAGGGVLYTDPVLIGLWIDTPGGTRIAAADGELTEEENFAQNIACSGIMILTNGQSPDVGITVAGPCSWPGQGNVCIEWLGPVVT